MKILFGSQTGTAEEFAKTLAAEAKSKGFAPKVMDLEEFKPPEALKKERGGLIVFVLATYGDGEPTDNAKPFHDWLIDDDKTGANNGALPFQGVRFTVFGLGNKTYAQYNAIGKLFFKKAKELGGEVAYEMGLGDDDGTLEEDFNKWKSGLWNALSKTSGLEVSAPETTQ
jgi:NADPH-ferrihemoprotein reductase